MFIVVSYLKIIAFIILLMYQLYWFIKGIQSNKRKKYQRPISPRSLIERIIIMAFYLIMFWQLAGTDIWSYSSSYIVPIIGFSICMVGIVISVLAREELSANWTESYYFQIKNKHTLVTTGIYRYIRHPIYCSIATIFAGTELLLQSYLILLTPFIILVLWYWATREEQILTRHFKRKYIDYQKYTYMLIPKII